MIQSARTFLRNFSILIIPLLLALPVQAGPLADMNSHGGTVVWVPHVSYQHITLTVSGPDGLYLSQDFDAGTNPALNTALPDGVYNYELTVTPIVDAATRQAMAQARAEGADRAVVAQMRRSGQLPQPLPRQSGHFSLQGGALIDRSATE